MTPETDSPVSDRPRRKWLSFRLTTLFVVITVAAILAASPRFYRLVQFQRFQWYVGRDLRTLSDVEREKLGRIIRDVQTSYDLRLIEKSFRPTECWYLWRMKSEKQDRFVLFQPIYALVVPADSKALVRIFDQRGNLIDTSTFTTGWGIDITDAALVSHPILNEPILRIDTDAVVPAEIAKQYYVLRDDDLILLRLEDGHGNPARNSYILPQRQIGPEPPMRSEAEWIAALSDPRPAEILRSLTWIGGQHGLPGEPDTSAASYKSADAALVLRVREDPTASASIEALLDSDNPWIADAARLALETMNSHAESSPINKD